MSKARPYGAMHTCLGSGCQVCMRMMLLAEKNAAKAPPKPKPRKRVLKAERLRQADNRAELSRHHSSKRRAERTSRTPPWADLDAIRALHAEAQRLTRETGIPHHVDHVIPLQGENVSGLHVHTNMQILTGTENSRKRNRYEAG